MLLVNKYIGFSRFCCTYIINVFKKLDDFITVASIIGFRYSKKVV